jgi:hypothetical protein
MPETEELSTAFITQLFQDRDTSQNTLLAHRKIKNSSFTGLLDTHINTLAHHDVPTDSAGTQHQQSVPTDSTGTQPQQSVPTHATPATQSRSATHYRHPNTNEPH